MITSRRSLLVGAAAALFCAPAIVRPQSIMRVKPVIWDPPTFRWVVAEHPQMPGEPFYLGLDSAEHEAKFRAGLLANARPWKPMAYDHSNHWTDLRLSDGLKGTIGC